MKRLLLPIPMIIMCAGPILAQKINPAGRLILDERRAVRENRIQPGTMHPLATQENATVRTLVSLNPGFGLAAINAAGYAEVTAVIGDVYVVVLPLDRVEEFSALDAVKSVSFGNELKPSLDFARKAGSVDAVQSGFDYNGTTTSFDGTGVVVGMMDVGLDANHVNFKNADGSTRVQRVWNFTGTNGQAVTTYTASNISAFTTDNKNESHGTHVAGIMGGSYKGDATVAYMTVAEKPASGGLTPNEFVIGVRNMPYYGVATNSELALAVGTLATPNIVQGVTNVIEYAESVGKPAVVNLSLGSNSGPHDGTDEYSRALSELGKRAIIVMAAGNEGADNISITKTLGSTDNDQYLRTLLTNNEANGVVDLWGTDNSVITLRLGTLNTSNKFTEILKTDRGGQSLSTAGKTAFTNNYNGTVQIYSGVDPNNQRYEVFIQFSNVSRKASGSEFLAIEATSKSGNTLYLYGNEEATFTNRKGTGATATGYSSGTPKNSISNACCAENILSVGAFTTRNIWGVLGTNDQGLPYGYTGSYPIGEIAPFSSYGTSFQGTKLPLVCAPGANIISSLSRYYVSAIGASNAATSTSAKAVTGTVNNYWGPMQGTSMACPFVTGTVGLWLQADPDLTYAQVLETVNRSSVAQDNTSGRWGAGKIDALAGMRYVLDNYAAIGTVFADEEQRLVITPGSGSCNVYVAGASRMTLKLIDLQGRTLRTVEASGDNADISTDGLAGLYLVEATTDQGRFTRKAVLR